MKMFVNGLILLNTVFLLLCSVPRESLAQLAGDGGTLQGRVTDAADGRPLSGVGVQVAGLSLSALTDDEGRFRFSWVPGGAHTVTFQLIGYLPETRAVALARNGSAEEDVALHVSPVALDAILVSAESALRRETPVSRIGNAISVVRAGEIQEKQYENLDDALREVPGLVVSRTGSMGNSTYLRMRGFTNKHVLILVDGVRVTNPAEFSNEFYIDNILMENVAQVEVPRGPQSVIYGSDAMAGVINVVTKRGEGGLLSAGIWRVGPCGASGEGPLFQGRWTASPFPWTEPT